MRDFWKILTGIGAASSTLENKPFGHSKDETPKYYQNKANRFSPSCPLNTPLSCSNSSAISDTCCFEYPGGVFLLTQFWDYMEPLKDEEKELLEKKFTLHGLWPDNCDGSYEQFCDSELNIVGYDIREMLANESAYTSPALPELEVSGAELLADMELFWKSNNNDDSSLWKHEYDKHGTCIKTMSPECYSRWFDFDQDGENETQESSWFSQWFGGGDEALKREKDRENQELIKKRAVYDYFKTTMKLYKKMDTFEILKQSGIVPSEDKTYTREEISEALKKGFDDKDVFFKCDRNNALNEIWYFHLVGQGSVLLNEAFVPIDSFRKYSNCPIDQIHFYPKGYKKKRPGNGGGGNDGKVGTGAIRISSGSKNSLGGFITRLGRWMSKGTEAKFDVFKSEFGNYLVRSSAGYCSVVGDSKELKCSGGRNNKNGATQFELNEKTGHLGYGGQYSWHSDAYPRGRQQSAVYHGPGDDDNAYSFELKFAKLY
ncbi:hypothetical protein ACO0QE_002435 [Hanseniaspora vineae]